MFTQLKISISPVKVIYMPNVFIVSLQFPTTDLNRYVHFFFFFTLDCK